MVQNPQQRYGSTKVDVSALDLTPEQVVRITRLARELRLTDQILSTDVDKVRVVSGQRAQAAAWTALDGDEVTFAADKMPDPVGRYELAVWLGTNAHELGHVLYSPRSDSPLMQRMKAGEDTFLRGLFQIHNIVEDQREERLLLARFSPWRGYLVAALGHHLHVDNDSSWLLLCGRTWLSAEVRAEARALFVRRRSEAVADQVADLVGRYQALTDPGHTEDDEAWDILVALHSLFDNEIPEGGCGGVIIEGGDPDTEPDEEGDWWPTADEEGDPQPNGDDDTDGPGEESDEQGNEGDSPSRDRKGDTAKDGDADKPDEGKSKGKSSQPNQPPKGQTPGGGAGAEPPSKKQQQEAIRKQLQKEAKVQIHRDDEATAELDGILDSLDQGRGADDVEGEMAVGVYREVPDSALRLRREVSERLEDFKEACEPGWERRTNSGRLNVRRVLDPMCDQDSWYDRYEPGALEATELEVVLLVDVSSSMYQATEQLGEACWVIRQAVDDVDGRITVLTYSTKHRVLARPGERPDDRMFVPRANGGTDPKTALGEAWQVLSGSPATNRLLIVMTDGEWQGDEKGQDQLIAAMGQRDVATVMAFLPDEWTRSRIDRNGGQIPMHGCQYGGRIDELTELPRLFGEVAFGQMVKAKR
jgi:hypothetical protein